MAKDDYLNKSDLIKVIRKYHRCKNEVEKDALRDVVVKNNIRLVMKLAKAYADRFKQNPDDLFQNGIIGILVALDRFKPNKKFAFSTYATYWVENFIRRAIDADKMINTHRYLTSSVGNSKIYFKAFEEADGDMDKFITLLRKSGISRKQQNRVEQVVSMAQESSFLDIHSTLSGREDDTRVIDVIEDKNTLPPDVEAMDNITKEKLINCINKRLTPIEKQVIEELYFLEETNISKLSNKIKKSKQLIATVEQRAIRKIARVMKGDKLFVLTRGK